MHVGFYLKWPKRGDGTPLGENVLGDEVFASTLCQQLRALPGVSSAEIYAPNYRPNVRLDVLVHLNDTPPDPNVAGKHVLYLQNFYDEGSDVALMRLQRHPYDGYAFISARLLEIHLRTHPHGIFLPFAVDLARFCPQPPSSSYAFDVVYVGNDIKGERVAEQYIVPAADFHFGLLGNWYLPWERPRPRLTHFKGWLAYWKAVRGFRPYQRKLRPHCRGNIPNERLPLLYSSAKVVLNCTARDSANFGVVTLRTLEVLASGGFLITDYLPAEWHGTAVVTAGGDELKAAIRYYMAAPEERAAIARTGLERVRAQGCAKARAETLWRYLRSL